MRRSRVPLMLKSTNQYVTSSIQQPALTLRDFSFSSHRQVPFPNYRPIDLELVVKDDQGRRFDNFSSLDVHWSVSDKSLATFQDAVNKMKTVAKQMSNGRTVLTSKQHRHFFPPFKVM